MNNKNIISNLWNEIGKLIDKKIDKYKSDHTFKTTIWKVNDDGTYQINYLGQTYNVPSAVGSLKLGQQVWLKIPNGIFREMHIYGTTETISGGGESSHTHSNLSVLETITSALINKWNDAVTKAHIHLNKESLDIITPNKIESWDNKSEFDGDYNSLINKPTIPSTDGLASEKYVDDKILELELGEDNVIETIKVNNTTLVPDKNKSVNIILPDTSNFVEKVDGKGLSTNDYTTSDKAKIDVTNIAYGTCSTDATTADKIITTSSNTNWKLEVGSIVYVFFTNTNTAQNPTLNVNGTGAKSIKYNNVVLTTSSLVVAGTANRIYEYMYDGTNFVFIDDNIDNNTTYTNASLGQGYGTCDTAETTTAKVVTLSSYALIVGGIVAVKFTYAVPASATMNINSKGAKTIYYRGTAITANVIQAGDIATFIYDGTRYNLLTVDRDMDDTHYGTCSTAAATVEKVVSCNRYVLAIGSEITVKFTVTNTSANPTLNVNSTGAKPIYYRGAAITAGYLAANRTYTFRYNGVQYELVGDLDSNTYDRIRYTAIIKCSTTAIVAGNLIVGNNGLYQHLKLGKPFDITYPILYAGTAIAASATGTNNYKAIAMLVTTTQSITLTAYKPVYIKGKLSGTIFTPVSTTPLTQTIPTSADGYQYILIGLAYNSTSMYLLEDNPIYEYKNGVFGLYGIGSGSGNGVNQIISTTEPTNQLTGDHWLLEF